MMRVVPGVAMLAILLGGCSTQAVPIASQAAAPTPIIVYVTPDPAPFVPTSRPTSQPTARPKPTADPDLVSACDALTEFRGIGDHLSDLVDTAFSAFDNGSYADWQNAATRVIEASASTATLLDEVPDREPYFAWKVSALEILLHLSSAVLAYDTGITEGSLTGMNEGNSELEAGSELTDAMNDFAAEFEDQC